MRTLLFASVAALGWSGTANATYIVTLAQVGPDVVATGSGSINLSALTFVANLFGGPPALIDPARTDLVLGGSSPYQYRLTGTQTLQPIGTLNVPVPATNQTGTGIALLLNPENSFSVDLPSSYVSGMQMSSSATFGGYSLTTLGLNFGSYTFNTGLGANVDSIVIQVGPAAIGIVEPATLALMALPVCTAGLVVARRRGTSTT